MKPIRLLLAIVMLFALASAVVCGAPKAKCPTISGFMVTPVNTDQCRPVCITLAITNSTNSSVYSQRPYTGTTYSVYQSFAKRGWTASPGRYMVGVSLNDGADGYPYRWGFRGELRPGRTTTILGYLAIPETGRYRLSAVLLNGDLLIPEAGMRDVLVSVDTCSPPASYEPVPAPPMSYYLNGYAVQSNFPPTFYNGHVMIPVQSFSYGVGAKLIFLDGAAIIDNGSVVVELYPGSPTAYVNGSLVILPVPPYYYGGSLYVSPRYISPFFGSSVYWDPYSRSLFMQGPQGY